MNGPIVILTGAGISAESGIATFRDKDGVWSKLVRVSHRMHVLLLDRHSLCIFFSTDSVRVPVSALTMCTHASVSALTLRACVCFSANSVHACVCFSSDFVWKHRW